WARPRSRARRARAGPTRRRGRSPTSPRGWPRWVTTPSISARRPRHGCPRRSGSRTSATWRCATSRSPCASSGSRRPRPSPPASERTPSRSPAVLDTRTKLLDEALVRRLPDDRLELALVVVDEADPLDPHILHPPLPTVGEPGDVVDVDDVALLRRDRRLDDRLVPVDGLRQIPKLLRIDQMDPRDVDAPEQAGKEPRELGAFRR